MDFCYNLSGNVLVDNTMRAISIFGDGVWIPVGLTIVTSIIFLLLKKRHFAMAILFAPLVGDLIKSGVKNLVGRPRPSISGCEAVISASGYAFPSGHTIFYTIYFGLLAWYGYKFLGKSWYGKMLSIFSLSMVLLIGISRVYLGVHWISDVLAGYFVGGVIVLLTIYLLNKYPDKQ